MSGENEHLLGTLYHTLGIGLDRLPYTTEFDKMHANFCAVTGHVITPGDLYRRLLTLRKAGKLPKVGR